MEIKQQHTLKVFVNEADRLIIKQITAPRIKGTRIRQLENHRTALEKLDEPLRSISTDMLDQLVAFAHSANADDAEKAQLYADQINASLERIDVEMKKVADAMDRKADAVSKLTNGVRRFGS